MKKILIALAMFAFGASALQQARGDDVSIDFFYNNLSGGNWIDVEGYGYGWQPDIAANDANWRPYADGYWAYTDDGWTWISYEDFGWATYHYGRWANLDDYGWVWFPGDDLDWGPAWVSWRTGGDYVGWAPLPPRGQGVVYEGRPIGPQVDIEFDIGPAYYNFIPVRYIGEPILRNYIVPRAQNITYINDTVNITNINVRNNVVYNYGPNYEVLSAASARPIQRLNIERQSATNLSEAARSGALTKVQGNKLVVAAPNKLTKPPPGAKPPTVKTKVAQPKINRGWAGVPNEAQLKQKIKTENPKNIPAPTTGAGRAPTGGQSTAVGASPVAPNRPGAATSPGQSGKPPGRVPPGSVATPAAGLSPSPQRNRPGAPSGRPQPGASPAARSLRTPPPAPERGQPQRNQFRPAPRPGESGAPRSTPEQGLGRGLETQRGQTPPPPAGPGANQRRGAAERAQPGVRQPPATPSTGSGPGEERGAKQRERPPVHQPPTTPPAEAGGKEGQGAQEQGRGAYGQPGRQPKSGGPPAAEHRPQQPERGKKEGGRTPPPKP